MENQKNFLFVSYDGYIGDVAWQIKKEGHNVKYYIDSKSQKDVCDGFIEKTDDYKKEIDWADVIIFDDVLGFGKIAEELRKRKKAVIGGTEYTDKLEDDRTFGQEEMKKYNINILPFKEFNSFDIAIDYVKKNKGMYALKPSGEAQNMKDLLFVSQEEDSSDLLMVLEDYKKAYKDKIPIFQLQKRVLGIEVGIGGFFNGNEFIYPININFEHKKLFPGNIGPYTGEMGTSMFWSMPNRLFNETLKKLEKKLKEEKYVGYIDINCIVNKSGIYPLEFTTRFGYPTISIQIDSLNMKVSDFFYKLANNEKFEIKTKSGFCVGVRVVVPPFPFDDEFSFNLNSKDTIIYFKKKSKNYLDGIHIEDIKIVNNEWVIAGTTGLVLIVCGNANTMQKAKENAYKKIKNIVIPNMYYRYDISDRWEEESDLLHNYGYLKEE
jgi:phosphoribosylamine---glycine ligase